MFQGDTRGSGYSSRKTVPGSPTPTTMVAGSASDRAHALLKRARVRRMRRGSRSKGWNEGEAVAVPSPGTQTEASSGAGSWAYAFSSPTKTGSVDPLDVLL